MLFQRFFVVCLMSTVAITACSGGLDSACSNYIDTLTSQ
jgi:hypothetical protein